MDETSIDSSDDNSFAGNWMFHYQNSSFSKSGDTISTDGLTLVADQSNGILKMLHFEYIDDAPDGGGGYLDTTYELDCYSVPYTLDTSNQIVVKVTGSALQMALTRCYYDNYQTTDPDHDEGTFFDQSNTYLNTAISTSSLTIRFIP